MSKELRQRLRLLEGEYPGQPLVAQQADLQEINRLRTELGMPLVDASLNEIGAKPKAKPKPKPKPREVQDHTEAREIYLAYLKKVEELEVHRAYADRVVKATASRGQTPVRPLATMGTNGGPLLCDHGKKPIVLEGGKFHGVTADVAWAQHPEDKWVSWILGGLVVEIQVNGTLRIYHGYPGRNQKHCCNIASKNHEKAREQAEADKHTDKHKPILAFLAHEFPDRTEAQHYELLSQIMDVMYSYDPGIGVNRPDV